VIQSRSKPSSYFWLASVLVFFEVIRRELNFLPELFIPSDFWRYLWAALKDINISLYIAVAVLAVLQYMGENAIVIPESIGEIVEEVSETIIYTIALIYLWRFKLGDFENYILHQPNQHEPCNANY